MKHILDCGYGKGAELMTGEVDGLIRANDPKAKGDARLYRTDGHTYEYAWRGVWHCAPTGQVPLKLRELGDPDWPGTTARASESGGGK